MSEREGESESADKYLLYLNLILFYKQLLRSWYTRWFRIDATRTNKKCHVIFAGADGGAAASPVFILNNELDKQITIIIKSIEKILNMK